MIVCDDDNYEDERRHEDAVADHIDNSEIETEAVREVTITLGKEGMTDSSHGKKN